MKSRIIFLILLSISLVSKGQLKSNNISVNLVGAPSWPLGLSYSQMLSERFSFEAGVGIYSAGIGSRYYITDPGRTALIFIQDYTEAMTLMTRRCFTYPLAFP